MPKKEVSYISVELIHQTEKAILVTIDEGENKVWLPKSLVEYEEERDGSYIVTGPVNFLKEKGLL